MAAGASSRTEYDGTITTIADRFEGKRFNSPNDIVCKSDGSIWFTDPPFGLLGFYEGAMAEQELPTNVYRVDAGTGAVTVVAEGINCPNGLAFSPDEGTFTSSNPAARRATSSPMTWWAAASGCRTGAC